MADPNQLHGYALQAEKNLEQLATGLSQAGADPQAIKSVSAMADACRQLVTALAKSARQSPPKGQPAEPVDDGPDADTPAELAADARQQPRPTMKTAMDQTMNDVRSKRGGH